MNLPVARSTLIAEHADILRETITGKRSKGTWTNLGGVYYDYALCIAYQGKKAEALSSLDSAYKYGWRVKWWYHTDPLLDPLRTEPSFIRLIKQIDDEHEFRRRAFVGAFDRAKKSSELREMYER